MASGLFYVKSDHELNIKVKKNSPRFPTVIYTPSNDQQFRRNNFWTMTGFAENWYFGQIAVTTGKMKYGAVRVGFFPWVENQKVGQLSSISISYL
jgi:hypothetical protein